MFEKCKILHFYGSRNSRLLFFFFLERQVELWTTGQAEKNPIPLSSVKYYKVYETQLIIFVVDTDTPAK